MYIKRNFRVKCPSGFYCGGCSMITKDQYMKNRLYCGVNGEFLEENKSRTHILKTTDCLKDCREHLKTK